MSLKNALLRPIEITTANQRLSTNLANYDVPIGVYANVLDLCAAIDALGFNAVFLNDSFRVVIDEASTAFTVTATALSRILGFAGGEAATSGNGYQSTATYCPEYSWVATYQASDDGRWSTKPGDRWSGSVGLDGNLSGFATQAPARRSAAWPWEHAYNSYECAARDLATVSGSSVWLDAERCFERIVNDSREAVRLGSDTVPVRGMYLIHDLSLYLGASPALAWPATWGSGGTHTDATAAGERENYLFVSAPSGVANIDNSDSRLREYYDLRLDLVAATAPVWS